MRLYRPENLTRAVAENHLGLTGNPIVRTIRYSAAVLDISGGDSFSDIYGKRRFVAVTQPKHLAIRAGVPLILMPQTYGPFEDPARRLEAADILRRSQLAFARDERSFRLMQDLLGSHVRSGPPPVRRRRGLRAADLRSPPRPRALPSWTGRARQKGLVAGFNVSGLLFNAPAEAMRQFGLKTDFRSLAMTFARRLLQETTASLLLMPHVLRPPGQPWNPTKIAVRAVHDELKSRFGDRIFVPAVADSATEAKWYISQLRLVHRRAHACHHRRTVLRRAGTGLGLQRQDARRVRKLRPGPQRCRSARAVIRGDRCSTRCLRPSAMPRRTAMRLADTLPQHARAWRSGRWTASSQFISGTQRRRPTGFRACGVS